MEVRQLYLSVPVAQLLSVRQNVGRVSLDVKVLKTSTKTLQNFATSFSCC